MKTIIICSSGKFYEHCNQVKAELETKGFKVVVPATATNMAKTGDYDIDRVKTWYDDPTQFHIKASKMRKHFEEVAKGDIVFVVNDEKHGVKGYIGSNVLMEMALGFYLNKPIYVLNPVDKSAGNYEEVVGMGSIIIDGDLTKIKKD